MKRKWMVGMGLMLAVAFGACEKEQLLAGSQQDDDRRMAALYREIDSLSGLFPCEDAGEWRFAAIGAKACGGPTGYVAYSTKLDVDDFLSKVDHYTRMQEAYNRKWHIASDCAYLMPPSHVVCEDGKAKLIWGNQAPIKSEIGL